MRLDEQARQDVHDFFKGNPAFSVVRKPRPQPRGMSVGIYMVDMEVTHLATGIKVVVPHGASHSEIRRYELAMAMFALPALLMGWDRETLVQT